MGKKNGPRNRFVRRYVPSPFSQIIGEGSKRRQWGVCVTSFAQRAYFEVRVQTNKYVVGSDKRHVPVADSGRQSVVVIEPFLVRTGGARRKRRASRRRRRRRNRWRQRRHRRCRRRRSRRSRRQRRLLRRRR